MMTLGRRLGTFSLSLGFFFILYFVFSASVDAAAPGFLLGGLALAGLGVLLLITHPQPPPPDSGRFRVLRRKSPSERQKKA
jgi:hypothetical protein